MKKGMNKKGQLNSTSIGTTSQKKTNTTTIVIAIMIAIIIITATILVIFLLKGDSTQDDAGSETGNEDVGVNQDGTIPGAYEPAEDAQVSNETFPGAYEPAEDAQVSNETFPGAY